MKQHYYITGVDGVGKTTQMDRLEAKLAETHDVKRVWLRFPVLFSFPLLVYARLFGYTKYQTVDGVRVGAWEFYRSRLLKTLFPWTQLLDTLIIGFFKVQIPRLQGKTLLFERYALDILVDVMVALGTNSLHKKLVGKLFLGLLPERTRVTILDAPEDVIRQRRPDLRYDTALQPRLYLFRDLTAEFAFHKVNASQPVDAVTANLVAELAC